MSNTHDIFLTHPADSEAKLLRDLNNVGKDFPKPQGGGAPCCQ